MVNEHTPGPWRHTEGGIIDNNLAISDPLNYVEIADVYGADQHDDRGPELPEAKANARLIALAPEMANALDRLLKHIDGMSRAGWLKANGNENKGLAIMALGIGMERAETLLSRINPKP